MKQYQNHNRSPICIVTDCSNKHLARGYCSIHYTRWRTKGTPNAYSKAIPNTYRLLDDFAEVDLRNRRGNIIGIAIVDAKVLQRVIKYRWCMDSTGYAIGRVNRKLVRLHRYLLNNPKNTIDHINRNKLDNRKINLRLCTSAQNSQNQSGRQKTSEYKGVSYSKERKWQKPRWVVFAKFPKSTKRFWGSYPSELEAAKAYNDVATLYGDEFTYLNKLSSGEKA